MQKTFRYGLPAIVGGFALMATMVSAPMSAFAVSSDCSGHLPNVTNNVTMTSDCEVAGTIQNDPNSVAGLAGVNAENFFGINTWSAFDSKDNNIDGVDEGPNAFGLSLVNNNMGDARIRGTWSIANFNLNDAFMILFKGGNKEPGRVVAYLASASAGAYESPFYGSTGDIPFTDDPAQISHVSLYVSAGDGPGGMNPVPVPAALPLFLTALGGLGFMARRHKSA